MAEATEPRVRRRNSKPRDSKPRENKPRDSKGNGEPLNIKDLKEMVIQDLNKIARTLEIEGFAGMRKQELIFQVLKAQTERSGLIAWPRRISSSTLSLTCCKCSVIAAGRCS